MAEEFVDIPMDIFESPEEIVVMMPLGGVEKSSIEITLENTTISVSGERKQPSIKENLVSLQQECFRGKFHKVIDLPKNVYFERIHSKLLASNVLMIVVPKVIIPQKVKLDIEVM